MTLPPSKGRWIRKEALNFQKELMTDIACALNHRGKTDLIEAFCSKDSMLTNVARQNGMKAERWTIDDYDLSSEAGYQLAEQRLRQLRPKRIWLSPECGPFSQMQNTNQRTPDQIANLIEKRKQGFKQWKTAFAWLGFSWRLVDISTSNNHRVA